MAVCALQVGGAVLQRQQMALAGDEHIFSHHLPADALRRRLALPGQLGARPDRGVFAAPRNFLSLGTSRSLRFQAVERRGEFSGLRLY
ncbi:MAG: hypothetical protein QE285_16075 [Aquabacterium sp.]|nr:hypothetical protein [Aquabacterium sp.]